MTWKLRNNMTKESLIHPNEPSLPELRKIRAELMGAPATDENLKKAEAIESQIKRHEEAAGE